MALQRFVGRRGLPNTIYTDNATTFQAANKELIALWNSLSSTKLSSFIPEMVFGGNLLCPRGLVGRVVGEVGFGITKQSLRKSIGRALLDEENLSTVW
ncbi:hypothetical protein JTE90_016197 [Oedothorax gibbosus]|uniref:Integrase catalytic domain-containing protein n=1 Tax=Oedothorax gibbosus TaxID=931172 RepID=A0AAV6TJ06_9ARAC|nr:hypothetical protein JTE90_016197 [Oedothorax gibbosus]